MEDAPTAEPIPSHQGEPSPAIELELAPAEAARLLRVQPLAACRAGRAGHAALKIVWHDTAEGALAARGLALSETQGQWRVERLTPGDIPGWPPATPAPILGQAPSIDALPKTLLGGVSAESLGPVAAFNGRRRDVALRVAEAPARLTVLEGSLRSLLLDEPVCRLIFSGDAPAMAALAAETACHVLLRPPAAGLAAHALAAAKGAPPQPRRLGAPVVPADASVAEAIETIVAHLADVILYWATQVGLSASPEPVHQMRVAVRRLRSALSVFRRAVPDDPTWLDDLAVRLQSLATLLGGARDWDVFLAETGASVAEALPGDRRIAGMLAAAARKRLAAYQQVREFLAAPENGQDSWRRLALTLALLPTRRPWSLHNSPAQAACLARPASDYAAGALDRRLKQLLSAGPSLEGLPHEQLHDIRKQAKRVRYTIEFFAPLFPEKAVRKYLARMQDLQEEFGTLNDTAVAAGLVATLGGGADRAFAAGAVQGFGAARMLRAERRVQRTWARFYRQTPFWD